MLVVAAVASVFACGIEYYVFAIAYPGFAIAGPSERPALHALHAQRIAYAIGPALLVAFGANAWLALARPRGMAFPIAMCAAIAGGAVLGYTAFVAVPLHARFGRGEDERVIAALNATEWVRALATFAQAACDIALLWLVRRPL